MLDQEKILPQVVSLDEEKKTASLIEELSDEVLTICVGGSGLNSGQNMNDILNQSIASTILDAQGGLSGYAAPCAGRLLSDRSSKENFATVDAQEVLDRVAKLPIQTWNYKQQNPEVRHIGPMAQDFIATLGVGESEQYINGVDANGVALAAIQALYKMLQEKEAQIHVLQADLSSLKQQNRV